MVVRVELGEPEDSFIAGLYVVDDDKAPRRIGIVLHKMAVPPVSEEAEKVHVLLPLIKPGALLA